MDVREKRVELIVWIEDQMTIAYQEKGGPAQMTLLYIVFAAGLTRPAFAIDEAVYHVEK